MFVVQYILDIVILDIVIIFGRLEMSPHINLLDIVISFIGYSDNFWIFARIIVSKKEYD